ncbi:HD domain-containing protein [Williamsia sterculiae]|uniref:HD domain-containing protein n=1 Tax=Williamsia sterculiae TaxID=1344003 RepID=A0A1N7HGG0_9NOCA|nr:HD domain-containing protein [Williamsia sterculiae]SIS23959.1 HD domain-containing protein [Williamsia sterculiae]
MPDSGSTATLVDLADVIAAVAHRGQVDRAGNAYIRHPRSVARRVEPKTDEAVATALLHDVIEDSDTTAEDLRDRGIPTPVVDAVVLLTRRDDLPDDDYYAGIRANELALAVKLADLADNTDPKRLGELEPDLRARLRRKYRHGYRALGRDDLAEALVGG